MRAGGGTAPSCRLERGRGGRMGGTIGEGREGRWSRGGCGGSGFLRRSLMLILRDLVKRGCQYGR